MAGGETGRVRVETALQGHLGIQPGLGGLCRLRPRLA